MQQHRPENLNPTTTAKISNLFLSPDDENSVIIFEDCDFVSDEDGEDTIGLVCTTGHAIAFRRCRFRGDRTSVFVGCFDDRELKDLSEPLDPQLNGNPKVLFGSCLFESFKPDTGSACVMVGSSGTATFLNCMFRKCNGGVKVRHGGKADLVHCTITDVFNCGVEVPRYGTCSMLHCLIEKVVCIGAAAMHGSNFVIMKSRVEGKMGCYSAGLIFTGKKGAPVIVKDCSVANCVFGIKAELHHVNVTVANTTFINCTKAGVVVNPNTLGTVTVNNCTFHHCNCTVGNASGEQCVVTVDGERQAPNDIPLSQCGCGRCLPCLAANRASKEAGMGTINCAKCAAEEPMDTKFKSCSKCKNVCYCSRECQTAHWKEHKSICDPRYKYSKLKFDA
uniref:MYND-type domain-containing protein n=1 Tax=Spumella elongata TaxID=89044 RepID=A0A7S3H3C9_9STRA|mmetsp:Transcript_3347/g.5583  ORF Transcript_3347/g.5583 Transcript_3347/m.5583 type:complete len:391 (+) Transcript_3347:449-1621(+)